MSWKTDMPMPAIKLVQRALYNLKFEPGPIDGIWGKNTQRAYNKYLDKVFKSESKKGNSLNTSPIEYSKEFYEAYGNPGEDNLVPLKLPYNMIVEWNTRLTLDEIYVHRAAEDSLRDIFSEILEEYGIEGIEENKLNIYSGCYANRGKRGNRRQLSMHAWGLAVDINSKENGLGVPWPEQATMPKKVVEIFEKHGWEAGARWEKPDAMHFQLPRTG